MIRLRLQHLLESLLGSLERLGVLPVHACQPQIEPRGLPVREDFEHVLESFDRAPIARSGQLFQVCRSPVEIRQGRSRLAAAAGEAAPFPTVFPSGTAAPATTPPMSRVSDTAARMIAMPVACSEALNPVRRRDRLPAMGTSLSENDPSPSDGVCYRTLRYPGADGSPRECSWPEVFAGAGWKWPPRNPHGTVTPATLSVSPRRFRRNPLPIGRRDSRPKGCCQTRGIRACVFPSSAAIMPRLCSSKDSARRAPDMFACLDPRAGLRTCPGTAAGALCGRKIAAPPKVLASALRTRPGIAAGTVCGRRAVASPKVLGSALKSAATGWPALGLAILAWLAASGLAQAAEPAAAVAERFDVVIVGATPGGIMAAVATARNGHTAARSRTRSPYRRPARQRPWRHRYQTRGATGGLFLEFISRIRRHYQETYGPDSSQLRQSSDGYHFEPHVAEKVFESLLAEHGQRIVVRRSRQFDALPENVKLVQGSRRRNHRPRLGRGKTRALCCQRLHRRHLRRRSGRRGRSPVSPRPRRASRVRRAHGRTAL